MVDWGVGSAPTFSLLFASTACEAMLAPSASSASTAALLSSKAEAVVELLLCYSGMEQLRLVIARAFRDCFLADCGVLRDESYRAWLIVPPSPKYASVSRRGERRARFFV